MKQILYDMGQMASPESLEVWATQKLKKISVS